MLSSFVPRKRIIIDTGNAIDDLIGVFMALGSHETEVLAITVPEEIKPELQNICKIAKKDNTPILSKEEGVDFITKTLQASQNNIYLASMGDFSTFAEVFDNNPELTDNFKQLIVSLKNISPKANKSIFCSKERITLISDSTKDILNLSEEKLEQLNTKRTAPIDYIYKAIKENFEKTGNNNFMLYNPLVIACILKPALCSGIFCGVSLREEEDKSYISDFSWNNNNILHIDNVNKNAFFEFLNDSLSVLF